MITPGHPGVTVPSVEQASIPAGRRRLSPATEHRLRRHPEYQRVYKAGRKRWARQIAYFTAMREAGSVAEERSATPGPRVGLTVPKALGKAVDRNRIKRRLRELVRQHVGLLGGLAIDVILHPKRSVLETDAAALDAEVREIFRAVRSKAARPAAPAGAPSARHPAGR